MVAKSDPRAALAAFETLPADGREQASMRLFEGWMSNDIMAAMRWGSEAMPAELFGSIMAKIESKLEPAPVMELIAEMSDEARGQLFDRLRIGDDNGFVQRLALTDPAASVAWLEKYQLLSEGSPLSEADAREAAVLDTSFTARLKDTYVEDQHPAQYWAETWTGDDNASYDQPQHNTLLACDCEVLVSELRQTVGSRVKQIRVALGGCRRRRLERRSRLDGR